MLRDSQIPTIFTGFPTSTRRPSSYPKMTTDKIKNTINTSVTNYANEQQQSIDKTAFKKMFHRVIKMEHKLNQMKKGCTIDCQCRKCTLQGYVSHVKITDHNKKLWSGKVIINPNTTVYSIRQVQLTFTHFANMPIYEHLTKLKLLIDQKLNAPIIRITNKIETISNTTVTANRNHINQLFVVLLLAVLTVNYKIYVKYQQKPVLQGILLKRVSRTDNWAKVNVRIQNSKIKFNNQPLVSISAKQLWTNFQFVDVQQTFLIIKMWEGFTKVQYGLPMRELSQWLSCFLNLIQANH